MNNTTAQQILAAAAISFGVTVGGMITTAVTGKHAELMLGGLVSTSLCGLAAGYTTARAECAFDREMAARR
jgi:hypothetical protein